MPTPSLQIRKLSQKVTRALIPRRVVVQIQLVVILGIPPLLRGQDLGHNAGLPPLLVDFSRHFARNLFLLRAVEEYSAAVLCPAVGALRVERRGVVHAVEELEELAVGDLGGVVDELGGFSVFKWGVESARVGWRSCVK